MIQSHPSHPSRMSQRERERLRMKRRLRERDRRYAANNPDALAPTRGRIPSGRGGAITNLYQPWH